MESFFIITFIGDDRPGLVEEVASAIESHRGNWHESRLSQLGGKFAGLVLVSLPTQDSTALEAALKGLSAGGLSIRVTPSNGGSIAQTGRAITLTVVGPDRLGIVKEVSHTLAQRKINVVEMDSHVDSAPMSSERMFHARIDAQVPDDTDLDQLHDTLDEIANHMTLDIDLESA